MKTAVITGCNRGLGKNLMDRFASEGYNIIAIIRKEDEVFVEEKDRLSKAYGISIIPIQANLEDLDSIKAALNSISQMECPIDVLINNAAINISKPAFYMAYQDIQKSFKINYFAPFLLSRDIGAIMIRQGYGSIINITSVAGLGSEPGGAAYDTSKAALNSFTRSFAQEVAFFNVRVNAVACSVLETDMFNSMKQDVQRRF